MSAAAAIATTPAASESSQRVEPGSTNIPVAQWPQSIKDETTDAASTAREILGKLNEAISKRDSDAVGSLFVENGYWRDHLALSWDFRTLKSKDSIASFLRDNFSLTKVELDVSSDWRSPQVIAFDGAGTVKGIQFYNSFATKLGAGRGVARLVQDGSQWKIWTFFTTLEELKGYEEPLGHTRAKGVEHGAQADRRNWVERRADDHDFAGSEPDVLIIGAGQGGLTAHARLKMLNIPALIIDSNDAVGDNWRKRYRQLVLHDPVWYDHLPYIPFPASWPIFTPKDKLAGFFESYAKLMELNVWTKTTIESSSWDDAKKNWTVIVKRTLADGRAESRTLHPKHIIQATGHSGKKFFPDIKGINDFKGDILCHSSQFPGAKPNSKGKKAIVVGACNSSHDICQDYYENGYDVTMVQRSSTCVVSSKSITDILLGPIYAEDGPPVEDADLWLYSLPSEVLKALHKNLTKKQLEADKGILDGLAKAGFKLDIGPMDCGLFMKYFQRGGGYYFDVGASELIIEGKVKVKQGQEIVEVLANGLKFADGTELQADEIVFATGYMNMRTQTRLILGDETADRVGDIWGFDDEGEFRTIWRKSGHPGFWFHGGNLALCRYFSRLLALQIKAQLEGLN